MTPLNLQSLIATLRHEGLLVALLLLAPLLAGVHASNERHVVCLEHQRVEHGDAAHASTSASDHEAPGVQLVAQRGESDEHEGCLLEPSLRERSFAGGEPARTSALPVLHCRPSALRAECGHVQVSLLRLAPKQSPPV